MKSAAATAAAFLAVLCCTRAVVAHAELGAGALTMQHDDTHQHDTITQVANATWSQPANAMATLLQSIRAAKCQKSVEYAPVFTYPPLQWSRQEGIYDSFVHLNFHGEWPQMSLLRNLYYFPDDNAFVTLFVVHSLVEIKELLGAAVDISDAELVSSLEAIGTHHDKNRPGVAPLMNFWNQRRVSDGSGYRATPPNIDVPLSQLGNGLNMVITAIKALGLDRFLAGVPLDTIAGAANNFGRAFGIPADSDDTGCNMALGAKLFGQRHKYPRSYAVWQRHNQDKAGLMIKSYLKYAYRPYAADYSASSIDPRTYVWMHPFLLHPDRRQSASFALITTWMQSVYEVAPQASYQRMPFNVNNVDVSVTANGLFGIVSYLAMNPTRLDKVTASLIGDNVDLLCWVLENRIVSRYPSLSLLYYPPKFAFYWFVARLATFMDETARAADSGSGMSPVNELFAECASKLSTALQLHGSKEIVRTASHSAAFSFWDDFLGMGDTQGSKAKPQFEDRVFSTAMAVNALIDTWTYRNGTNADDTARLVYYEHTPASVVQTIDSAVYWLRDESHAFPKENAFFSSSIKNGGGGNPSSFPHNTFRLTNGTDLVKCSRFSDPTELGLGNLFNAVAAVTGIMSADEWQQLVQNQICLGARVPVESFAGNLNCADCVFPYWSSPALTNTMHLLAAAKHSAIAL